MLLRSDCLFEATFRILLSHFDVFESLKSDQKIVINRADKIVTLFFLTALFTQIYFFLVFDRF